MENKSGEFLDYIKKPLSKESVDSLFILNNIIYERSVIYKDFILSLVDLVCKTYMGDEITDEESKVKHFDWCWDRTVNAFALEGVDFSDNKELYDYFQNFMAETFYIAKLKNESQHFNLLKLWTYLFGYSNTKTQADVDSFLEVYKLFDISLKKKSK